MSTLRSRLWSASMVAVTTILLILVGSRGVLPTGRVTNSPGSEVAPQTKTPAQPRKHGHVCYPPAWGGIVPGYTEDRDVVAMYGAGLFSADLGHVGGRYYTSPNRSVTLVVEIGVDNVIESVQLKAGLHPPAGHPAKAIPASRRMDPLDGFGNWSKLNLGASREQVQQNLGSPMRKETDSKGRNLWIYDTDYKSAECFIAAELSIQIAGDHVIAVTFYNGE